MRDVLYYPTIEFRDEDHLKKSLLLWQRIYRIVPDGYSPRDSAEVIEAVAAGRVVNLSLSSDEKYNAAGDFLDFYATRQRTRLVWPAGFDNDEEVAGINVEKIDAKLIPLFEQLAKRIDKEGFMAVPRELAGAYMFYLSKAVAQHRALALTTDTADAWTVGTYFANDGAFGEQVYAEDAENYLGHLAVEDLLPQTLTGVPMHQVLEFTDKFSDERASLEKEFVALQKEIAACRSTEQALYIVKDFAKSFVKAKDDYRATLRTINKRDVYTLLSVGLPVAMGFLSLHVASGVDPYDSLRLAEGTLLGAVSALAARELAPDPKTIESYLVAAEGLRSGSGIYLHRLFEEFIND
jgi:hypothetical protein